MTTRHFSIHAMLRNAMLFHCTEIFSASSMYIIASTDYLFTLSEMNIIFV